MIKLSNRLNAIANLVNEEDNVIDIGCDHALLDIYLANKYNKSYVASDLRESALVYAKSNINKYNVSDRVVLKCGNGIETINDKDDIDTIIISGLGFQTIINILKNIKNNNKIKKLIIQSNSYPEKVRKYIINNGYYIEKEDVVLEKNFYYIITSYKRGKNKYRKVDIEVGILNNSDISKKYIEYEIKKCMILNKLVPLSVLIKKIKIKKRLKLLNKKKDSI